MFEKIEKYVNLLVKIEAHAILMILTGVFMCLHGNKEEGQLIIGAGLAVFKGHS